MAEHDEKNFEHEFAEMFKKFDEEIKIPEIPDAQSIFVKAETKKENTIPFKKYSKYAATAAGVVLICASVPIIANAVSGKMAFDNAAPESVEEPGASPEENRYITDSTENEIAEIIPEEPQEFICTEAEEPGYDVSDELKETETSNSAIEKPMEALSVKDVLYRFFEKNTPENSSSGGSDDVKTIEEYINKKRTVEVTIENGSVSILVRDNSANEEMINAFWVEGTYESSYIDGEYYVINLSKEIYPEDIENEYYLPMVGDANGTHSIPEENIFIPDEIKKGILSLSVEVHVGTGEYLIYASLV